MVDSCFSIAGFMIASMLPLRVSAFRPCRPAVLCRPGAGLRLSWVSTFVSCIRCQSLRLPYCIQEFTLPPASPSTTVTVSY